MPSERWRGCVYWWKATFCLGNLWGCCRVYRIAGRRRRDVALATELERAVFLPIPLDDRALASSMSVNGSLVARDLKRQRSHSTSSVRAGSGSAPLDAAVRHTQLVCVATRGRCSAMVPLHPLRTRCGNRPGHTPRGTLPRLRRCSASLLYVCNPCRRFSFGPGARM